MPEHARSTDSTPRIAALQRVPRRYRPRVAVALACGAALGLALLLAGLASVTDGPSTGAASAVALVPRHVKALQQDAALARNCHEPTVPTRPHSTLSFVWPAHFNRQDRGPSAIEKYGPTAAPSITTGHVDDWFLNPYQTVTYAWYSLKVGHGLCSAPLPLKYYPGTPFSLGNGEYAPTIVEAAVIPKGDSLAWVALGAVNNPHPLGVGKMHNGTVVTS